MIAITYTRLEPYVNILTLVPFCFDILFTQYSPSPPDFTCSCRL